MQSSPSRTRNRRLLGARVLQQSQHSQHSNQRKLKQLKDLYLPNLRVFQNSHSFSDSNKENKGNSKEYSGSSNTDLSAVGHSSLSNLSVMDNPEDLSYDSIGSMKKTPNGNKKVAMSWDELQQCLNDKPEITTANKSRANKFTSKSVSSTTNSSNQSFSDLELSPKSASSSQRKGSDMKYSSIADNFIKQVPSARTISDQCFPVSSASSSSASSVGLTLNSGFVDSNENNADISKTQSAGKQKLRGGRGRMLHERQLDRERENKRRSSEGNVVLETFLDEEIDNMECPGGKFDEHISSEESLSPDTLKIIDEVETVYQTSPIPPSYAKASTPKKSPTIPVISLNRDVERSDRRDGPKIQARTKVAKNFVEASDLLKQHAVGKKETKCKSKMDGMQRNGTDSQNRGDSDDNTAPRKLLTANTSFNNKSNIQYDREAHSAPNESAGRGKSPAWEMFSETSNGSMPMTNHQSRRKLSIDPKVSSGKKIKNASRSPSPFSNPSGSNSSKKPVALAVKRERQQRKQRLSDAKCPSNSADGRRNLDKRTARLRFAHSFNADIMKHRQCFPHLNCGSNHFDKIGSHIQDRGVNGVSVIVRKRPIFDYELDRGDYDIVSIDNSTDSTHDTCVVHNCVMHPDMKQMLMKPTSYVATAAFDEHCSDDDVYRHVAEPLVMEAANQGVATILMYGQTGCGKSHTMSGIESRSSHGVFEAVESLVEDNPEIATPTVTVQFVELCGKDCRDLLVKKPADVKLADQEDGSVKLVNAKSIEVTSPDELLEQILLAKGRRATEATDKNGVSSRSHAVCQIQIKHGQERGVLTLIDCAGSERRHDSMYHSSERQKESAEINASLYCLKDCIRARASSTRIPYRNNNLTRILRESFERNGARLCVIACVAPNATDTEHTMETLKTVSSIVGFESQIKEEKPHSVSIPVQTKQVVPPKHWDNNQLRKFLAHKKMTKVNLSDKHDGKYLMKMSLPQMRAQLFSERDKDMAEKLFNLLRKENDRVDKILRAERNNLANERKGRI